MDAATRDARIQALKEAIDAISLANAEYWRGGPDQDRDARAEHHRRQEQLEEIRRELARLQSL